MSYPSRKAAMALLFLSSLNFVAAQNYAVSNIPEALKKKANAITRDESMRIVIKDAKRAIVQMKTAVTVLNEEGAKDGTFSEFYDNLVSLNSIEGTLYDA